MPFHPLDRDWPLPEEDQVTNDDLMAILAGDVLPKDLKWKKQSAIQRRELNAWIDSVYNDLGGYLTTVSTHELLEMLHVTRLRPEIVIRYWFVIPCSQKYGDKTAEELLRDELARRPHIPTKRERSALRRSVKGRERRNGFRK